MARAKSVYVQLDDLEPSGVQSKGESDDEEESDGEEVPPIGAQTQETKDEHVPQAFTHFTYRHSKRRLMVCDLQGVLHVSVMPHLFEFTDPCIHYRSTRGRQMVFGRTDRGKKGMQQFFQTHTCNPLCKILGLRPIE